MISSLNTRVSQYIVLILKYIFLVLLVLFCTFPLYWMIVTSFKTSAEVYAYPPSLIPSRISFANYIKILKVTDLGRNFLNSSFVAFSTTVLVIMVSAPCGFSLARFRYRGLSFLAMLMLYVYMIPGVLIVIPLFVTAYRIGLADNLYALILINLSFSVPIGTWLLRSYFTGIPRSLEDAALIDGATYFQILRKIMVPLALPGIVSTAVFTFIISWNEYLFAMIFLRSAEKWTLPLALATMMGGERDAGFFGWELVMAASVLITVPSLVYMIIAQKGLISGMGGGGIKG